MNIQPLTLRGTRVRLEPLSVTHHRSLCDVGLDPELWRLTTTLIRTPEEMEEYIGTALRWQAAGSALPFAIIENSTDRAVGSTRYANIDRANRRLEIGWTWVAREWQRTAVNTEAKYLLLRHAFEFLGSIRVEFKTDSLNLRYREALLRIGAKEEGILRNHMIVQGGRFRHSVYFSIINAEWPAVKLRLEAFLKAP